MHQWRNHSNITRLRINARIKWWLIFLMVFTGQVASAAMDHASMTVWVNEAIVETYTYQYDDYLARQKVVAHYFTAKAWMDYLSALNESKLLTLVKKEKYSVSAVATMPPTISSIAPHQWKAVMPLLVRYQSSTDQQKQYLEVTVEFTDETSGAGVRGLALESIQTKKTSPLCPCGPNP